LTSAYSVVISVHVKEYFERGWRTTYSKRVMYVNNVIQNPINIGQMIRVDMRSSLQDMLFALCIVISVCPIVSADDGYDLWMSYKKLDDVRILKEYQQAFSSIVIQGDSDTLRVIREEVKKGLKELLGVDLPIRSTLTKSSALVIGTPKQSHIVQELDLSNELAALGHEGYLIRSIRVNDIPYIIITANENIGLLYLCKSESPSRTQTSAPNLEFNTDF